MYEISDGQTLTKIPGLQSRTNFHKNEKRCSIPHILNPNTLHHHPHVSLYHNVDLIPNPIEQAYPLAAENAQGICAKKK